MYEQYNGCMFKNIAPILKLNSETDSRVQTVLNYLVTAAAHADIKVDYSLKTDETLLVAIGGDGTMLEAMRQSVLNGATCLGINLGRVGFLTDLSVQGRTPSQFIYTLTDILTAAADTWVEERRVLVANTDNGIGVAGNEVSVSTKTSDSMICYRLKIGNMVAGIHRANAIMVSTATGSTAYSLSAGGALMMPDLASVQIVPVAPLTLTSRPIVVPSHVPIQIEAWGGPISVRFDGQVEKNTTDTVYTKEKPFTVRFNTFAHPAKLLHLDGWNYFDVLTEKLGWIREK